MPRIAREKSKTGIYHVMLMGINQQKIFEDDEDCEKFLEILCICKKVSGFKLFAYCLMGNHVHLLMKAQDEDLDQIFKRIGARYVYWYNWKYRRVGHLFQDRFKSEPINSDKYFLTVLRYIHQNPIKAKLCDTIKEYKWSSYREYIGDSKTVDTRFPLEMTGLDEFIRFNNSSNNDVCLECSSKIFRFTDAEAQEMVKKICKCDKVEDLLKLCPQERESYIKKLKNAGISIRQMSRLTGISKGIIEKILKQGGI